MKIEKMKIKQIPEINDFTKRAKVHDLIWPRITIKQNLKYLVRSPRYTLTNSKKFSNYLRILT